VHEMGSEWSDACASLISFTATSSKPQREVQVFIHTIVRLFSLLHAMALEEIASLSDENFPLIDVQGWKKKDLHLLFEGLQQGRKMTVVMNWIKVYLLKNHQSGIIAVPAPILTRVFQELGAGLVRCHNAQQIVIWPFPFPYTQINLGLIYVYMLVTPVVIATWDSTPDSVCVLFTLVSMVCMLGLDIIASELENPFGTDPNDLPTLELQHEMNRNLICLLQPQAWDVPELTGKAVWSFEGLVEQNNNDRTALAQFQSVHQSTWERIKQGKGIGCQVRKNSMTKQMTWAKQVVSDHHIENLTVWLRTSLSEVFHHQDNKARVGTGGSLHSETSVLHPTALTPKTPSRRWHDIKPNVGIFDDRDDCGDNEGDGDDDGPSQGTKSSKLAEEEHAASLPATATCSPLAPSATQSVSLSPDSKDPPWRQFLIDLDGRLRGYLDNQMRQLDAQLQRLASLQVQQVMLTERSVAAVGGGSTSS